jgi:hypothetical protein
MKVHGVQESPPNSKSNICTGSSHRAADTSDLPATMRSASHRHVCTQPHTLTRAWRSHPNYKQLVPILTPTAGEPPPPWWPPCASPRPADSQPLWGAHPPHPTPTPHEHACRPPRPHPTRHRAFWVHGDLGATTVDTKNTVYNRVYIYIRAVVPTAGVQPPPWRPPCGAPRPAGPLSWCGCSSAPEVRMPPPPGEGREGCRGRALILPPPYLASSPTPSLPKPPTPPLGPAPRSRPEVFSAHPPPTPQILHDLNLHTARNPPTLHRNPPTHRLVVRGGHLASRIRQLAQPAPGHPQHAVAPRRRALLLGALRVCGPQFGKKRELLEILEILEIPLPRMPRAQGAPFARVQVWNGPARREYEIGLKGGTPPSACGGPMGEDVSVPTARGRFRPGVSFFLELPPCAQFHQDSGQGSEAGFQGSRGRAGAGQGRLACGLSRQPGKGRSGAGQGGNKAGRGSSGVGVGSDSPPRPLPGGRCGWLGGVGGGKGIRMPTSRQPA